MILPLSSFDVIREKVFLKKNSEIDFEKAFPFTLLLCKIEGA